MASQMARVTLLEITFCEIYKRMPVMGEKRKILTVLSVKF
jgi:hypothetical protein